MLWRYTFANIVFTNPREQDVRKCEHQYAAEDERGMLQIAQQILNLWFGIKYTR